MPSKKQEPNSRSAPAPESLIDIPPHPERKTKQALLLELIRTDGGAALEELTSVTGWLPHTVRSAITGLRKRGHDVRCERIDGVSRYVVGSSNQ